VASQRKPKATLAEQLAAVVADHDAIQALDAHRRHAEEYKRRQADEAAARAIVAGIPEAAKGALAAGRGDLVLYEGDSVTVPNKNTLCLTGVPAAVYKLLAAEKLETRLWVDIDASGNFDVRNTLMFRIRSGE